MYKDDWVKVCKLAKVTIKLAIQILDKTKESLIAMTEMIQMVKQMKTCTRIMRGAVA